MATYDDPDICPGKIQCPYDRLHLIDKERMQFHLLKCERANKHRKGKMFICPFNATHHIEPNLINAHVANCSDRILFDAFKYEMANENSLPNPLPPIPTIVSPSEEKWSDGEENAGYDPSQAVQSNVLRVLRGATPSERRAFRMAQRRNYNANN